MPSSGKCPFCDRYYCVCPPRGDSSSRSPFSRSVLGSLNRDRPPTLPSSLSGASKYKSPPQPRYPTSNLSGGSSLLPARLVPQVCLGTAPLLPQPPFLRRARIRNRHRQHPALPRNLAAVPRAVLVPALAPLRLRAPQMDLSSDDSVLQVVTLLLWLLKVQQQ